MPLPETTDGFRMDGMSGLGRQVVGDESSVPVGQGDPGHVGIVVDDCSDIECSGDFAPRAVPGNGESDGLTVLAEMRFSSLSSRAENLDGMARVEAFPKTGDHGALPPGLLRRVCWELLGLAG